MIGTWFKRRLRSFAADEGGSVTVEFLFALPLFTWVTFSSVDMGVMLSRYMMLERALDHNVRKLRLGVPMTYDELLTNICIDAAIIQECATNLVLELRPINTATWNIPEGSAPCYNRQEDIQPVTEFEAGQENEIMLVRACIHIDPLLTGIGIGEVISDTFGGEFTVKTASVFVNEPN